MTEPADTPTAEPVVPDGHQELDPPSSEAERQAQATIRSVSRLEESN